MKMRKPFLRATLLGIAILLILPTGSLGGMKLDPNLGDEVLGISGGVRYASDTESFDAISGSADPEIGCGGPRWQVIGGGGAAGGPAGQAWTKADRSLDFDDADDLLDDGWYSIGNGPGTAEHTGYSICIRDGDIRYRSRAIADSPSGLRSGSAGCSGAAWHVTSGSVFIATTGSWATSSYPKDGPDADHRPDDGWQGGVYDAIGGMGGFSVYAICVRGETLRYVKEDPVQVAAGEALVRRAGCPTDEHVVGGGVRTGGPENRSRLVATMPYDGNDADGDPDDGWRVRVYNVGGAAKQVTAYAVCLS